jgi:hypothetical protein
MVIFNLPFDRMILSWMLGAGSIEVSFESGYFVAGGGEMRYENGAVES